MPSYDVQPIPKSVKQAQREFPLPDHRFAMLSVDGALLDKFGKPTDARIHDRIRRSQAAGWINGLCADTYQRAVDVRAQFDLNGPIIAERGAVLEWKGGPHYDKATAERYTALRKSVVEYLRENNIRYAHCYPDQFQYSGQKPGRNGEPIVFINPYRLCSASIWPRRFNGSGGLVGGERALDWAAETILPFFHYKETDRHLVVNKPYGEMVTSPKKPDTEAGIRQLKEHLGITGKIAMLGSGIAQYVGDEAVHYAASDAPSGFRAQCAFVAPGRITTGVVEVLQKLTHFGDQKT